MSAEPEVYDDSPEAYMARRDTALAAQPASQQTEAAAPT